MAKPALKISAREVLKDLRSGLEDNEFMVKYNLTYRQLQRLFRKMIDAGYVSPLDLAQRLCVTESQVADVMDLVSRSIAELDEDDQEY